MRSIHKRILTDERERPVAVQIDYADWLEIEEQLGIVTSNRSAAVDLNAFAGILTLSEDPLAFQDRMRGEWS